MDRADYWKTYSFTDDPDFRVADLTIGDVEKLLSSLDDSLVLAKAIIKDWFPVVMAYWSEEAFGSGWANGYFHIPWGKEATNFLGEAPTWDDEASESGGLRITWKPVVANDES